MRNFIFRRFIYAIISVIAATFLVFGLSRMSGDPRLLYAKPGGYGNTEEQWEALGKKLGLDKPFHIQYLMYLGRTLKGDLGKTLLDERPVLDLFRELLWSTVSLGLVSWVFATALGIPLGILSAVKRGSLWDYIARGVALLGVSMPTFWLAIILILVFAVNLGWLPAGTRGNFDGYWWQWKNLSYYVLPSFTLGIGAAAGYLRITRSAMLEVLDSEYVKLARAKGVSNNAVIWKHAFKNALIPPLTIAPLLMVSFITGVIVTESIFAWPGLGRIGVDAIGNNDFPVLTATVLFFAIIFAVVNFLTDIAYAFIDPRIRYS